MEASRGAWSAPAPLRTARRVSTTRGKSGLLSPRRKRPAQPWRQSGAPCSSLHRNSLTDASSGTGAAASATSLAPLPAAHPKQFLRLSPPGGCWAPAATSAMPAASVYGTSARDPRSRQGGTRARSPAWAGSTTTATGSNASWPGSRTGAPSSPAVKSASAFLGVLNLAATLVWAGRQQALKVRRTIAILHVQIVAPARSVLLGGAHALRHALD